MPVLEVGFGNGDLASPLVLPVSSAMRHLDFPGGSDGKESTCNEGDPGLIPGSGRSSKEGHGNPVQYYGLENSKDRGTWWATVHEGAKSWTWITNTHFFQISEYASLVPLPVWGLGVS